ncbi:DUF2934 domain-containing protein [Bradyrhizobium rifense]|uniref:DUF2934 domain-containing protein n=1 Tax=Bradyrhizobium rifense TaxID=515499 RepID=A0A5D3K7M5_9BRAD|nr:DUF2934 domain-containing protein [Bradyrhizobium rifense]
MSGLSEDDIRARAYQLWRDAGEPSGKMDTLWYDAEKQLLAERSAQGELPPGMTDNLLSRPRPLAGHLLGVSHQTIAGTPAALIALKAREGFPPTGSISRPRAPKRPSVVWNI